MQLTKTFGDTEVRVEMLDGEPWFHGGDLCQVLEYKSDMDAIHTHVPSPYRDGDWLAEQGAYLLIMSSRTAAARLARTRFAEILVEFRKGVTNTAATPEQLMAQGLIAAQQLLQDTSERLEIAAPKAAAFDRAVYSGEGLGLRELAKLLGIGPTALTAWMIENNWLYYDNHRKRNLPHQPKINAGLVKLQFGSNKGKQFIDVFYTPQGVNDIMVGYCREHDDLL